MPLTMQATQTRDYTPEEYLAIEEFSEYKSEYINGQIVPMAGGSTNHNRIALNFSSTLNFAFKQQDYEVFIGDVRLWIPEERIFAYPDVMIIAGEPEYVNNRTDIIVNPVVIIEVLSKSTQAYDPCGICEAARGKKFNAYRTIPSFQEYLLVDQTRIHVEQSFITGKSRDGFENMTKKTKRSPLQQYRFRLP